VAASLELATRLVALGAEVVRTLAIDTDALVAAAGSHFTGATDLAEELVLRTDLDYRSAYRVVGHAVAAALQDGRSVLAADDLARASAELLGRSVDVAPGVVDAACDPALIVAGRTALGGSSPARVREHARALNRRADDATRWRSERRAHAVEAERALVAAAESLAVGAS
jgi:argininosuccinate lyase